MNASQSNIFAVVLDKVHQANRALMAEGLLPAGIDQSRVVVEPPREASHGDMATNAGMVLAKGDGAGEGCWSQAARTGRRHCRKAARRFAGGEGRSRRTGLHQSDIAAGGLARCLANGA